MLAWAIDDNPPQLYFPDNPAYCFPGELADLLADPQVEKWAYQAAFERLIFKYVLKMAVPIEQWRCAQVLGRYHSLPSNLEDVGAALGLPADELKVAQGKALIRLFCVPYIVAQDRPLFGPTPAVFLDARTHPAEWTAFGDYAMGDIVAERGIVRFLDKCSPLPQRELEHYWMDQRINDLGIPVDVDLVRGARTVITVEKTRLFDELRRTTGLENPNSDKQVLDWVRSRGYPFSKIGKDFVRRALAGEGEITDEARAVLLLRTQLAKSSVDKFDAFEKMMGADLRLHHQFAFMGAARTGRYASKGINIQNLLRPVKELEDEGRLAEAVRLLTDGAIEIIRSTFTSSVLDVAASCLRPVFKAPPGSRFIIADLSQIENIMVGWLSGCKRIIKVYTSPPPYDDAYKDFAVEMFGIPYLEVTKAQRNICKPAVLGCGYRLSAGRVETDQESGDTFKSGLLGYAEAMGVQMTQKEAEKAVKVFRDKFPEVVRLWHDLERAFYLAVEGIPTSAGRCDFEMKAGVLRILLPSGRYLHYFKPRVERTQAVSRGGREYEKKSLYYYGQNAETHQWSETDTHGGKILENISQAIARDVLLEGMRRAEAMGFWVVAHVHDEIIAEVKYSSMLSVEDLEQCMADAIDWAVGLPLKAAGFESEVYRKGG
jgi:DNA polymerase bacteriophage-type